VQSDAMAMRRFFFHPEETAPERALQFAGELAKRQFGEAAAQSILVAWQEIEAAQQIQSDHIYYWHLQRPGWSGPVLTCPLTLEALKPVALSGGDPPKPHGQRDYAPYREDVTRAQALGPALRSATEHFAKAVTALEQAAQAMPADQRSGYEHWYTPEPNAPARLSPREVLEKELVAVRLQARTQARMSRFYAAWAIVHSGEDDAEGKLARLRAEDEANR